jgi:hypothetical protein
VIIYLKIIVLNQLQPPSLTHVQVNPSKNITQALVVNEDMNKIPQEIVLACLQGKENNSQLKIMRGIVIFMTAQLS